MTDKPYQFSHVRLFHLAAFFKDHGCANPPGLEFDANTQQWVCVNVHGAHVQHVVLNQVVKILTAHWQKWWENLPTLSATITNAVLNQGSTYAALWDNSKGGAGKTIPHAIRDAVRSLLVYAKELRGHLKAVMFSKTYGSKKLPLSPKQEELSQRLDALFKALTPAKKSDQIDAEVAASFPDPDKPSWINKKSLAKLAQDMESEFGDDALPPDALDTTPVKDAVGGMDKPNANGNAFDWSKVFGKKKAAEMKAAEDVAFAEIDALLATTQKGIDEIVADMKAQGVTVDAAALKALTDKLGAAKTKTHLAAVLHGKQSSIPGVPVTFKKDSPVLDKLSDDDEESDAPKGATNFLIQAKAAETCDAIKALNTSELGKHFNFVVDESAKDIVFLEPTQKALELGKLDFAALEEKLLKELAHFPMQVKVEPQESDDPTVAKLKVTIENGHTKKYALEQLYGKAPFVDAITEENKKVAEHLQATMLSSMHALSNYGVTLTHKALSNFFSGKSNQLFPKDASDQSVYSLAKLKQQLIASCKKYQESVLKQHSAMQKEADRLAEALLKELEAKHAKKKKKKKKS